MTKRMGKASRDSARLREAAQRIENVTIPHVISEERWTARSCDDVDYIKYSNRRYFPFISNISHAVETVLGKQDSWTKIFIDSPSEDERFRSMKEVVARLRWAYVQMGYRETSMPDSQVDGNLVHWSEHAAHIALWSPVVAESVRKMLLEQADLLDSQTNRRTGAPDAMMQLAEDILGKEIYSDAPQERITTKPTLTSDVAQEWSSWFPATKHRRRERMDHLKASGFDSDAIRGIMHTCGGYPDMIVERLTRQRGILAQKMLTENKVPKYQRQAWETHYNVAWCLNTFVSRNR